MEYRERRRRISGNLQIHGEDRSDPASRHETAAEDATRNGSTVTITCWSSRSSPKPLGVIAAMPHITASENRRQGANKANQQDD